MHDIGHYHAKGEVEIAEHNSKSFTEKWNEMILNSNIPNLLAMTPTGDFVPSEIFIMHLVTNQCNINRISSTDWNAELEKGRSTLVVR